MEHTFDDDDPKCRRSGIMHHTLCTLYKKFVMFVYP
jgi:hypothetical protein